MPRFAPAAKTLLGAGAANENFWEVPASWLAVVQGGLLAEWRVYADNQPLRKLMGDNVP